MTRSIRYASGSPDRLRSPDVKNIPQFTMYARQEIGVGYPVGVGRRESWMRWAKEEMSVQGWTIPDAVKAVDFIKATNAKCRTLQGIFWYVEEAKTWHRSSRTSPDFLALHEKVAKALNVEQDEAWQRKLSLAQGRALEQVYAAWESERGAGHSGVEGHRDDDRLHRDVPVDRPAQGGNVTRRYFGGLEVSGVLPMEA